MIWNSVLDVTIIQSPTSISFRIIQYSHFIDCNQRYIDTFSTSSIFSLVLSLFSHFRKDFEWYRFPKPTQSTFCVLYTRKHAHTHMSVVYTTWNMQATLIVVNPNWIYTVIIFVYTRLHLTFLLYIVVNNPGHRWVAMQNIEEANEQG